MGQNSSKRRSVKIRSKNGTHNLSQGSNVDDQNGNTEVEKRDVIRQDSSPPTSPKSISASSNSPSTASGKKEKKKRFRVSFSLNRTPSGRWSRKKKSSSLNGTRPVSCPEPLRLELDEKPGRPHSLFLEEVEIPEEDNKEDTVDLSDNEEVKPKSPVGSKSPPKAPERSKWKRGSNKKSSGKKKKKDKPSPKKEKKKKSKSGDNGADANVKLDKAVVAQVATTSSSVDEHNVIGQDSTHTLKIEKPDDENVDIETIASSIVAETLEVAQGRLRSETCNGVTCTFDQQINDSKDNDIHKQIIPEIIQHETLSFKNATKKSIEEDTEKDNTKIDTILQSVDVSKPTDENNKTIKVMIADFTESVNKIDQAPKTIEENSETIKIIKSDFPESANKNEHTEETKIVEVFAQEEIEVVSVPVHETQELLKINQPVGYTQSGAESEQPIISLSQVKTENSCPSSPEILDSLKYLKSTNFTKDAEIDEENYETEEIARKIVESVIAASIEVVRKDDNDEPIVNGKDKKANDNGSDLHQNDDSIKDGQRKIGDTQLAENMKNEAPSQKKVKDKVKKNKNENAENKTGKDKSKSESKITVTKKLSNWFHKKDKSSKSSDVYTEEISTSDTSKNVSLAVDPGNSIDSEKDHTTELKTHNVHVDPIESHLVEANISGSPSLTIAAGSILLDSTITESSPDHTEIISPSSTVSIASPISNTTKVTTQPSPSCDDGTSPGGLKKISIGSRLKTAILRKKSSGSSDDQDKKKHAQPKEVTEATVITPPPRKARQKKSDKQHPQDTPKTHKSDTVIDNIEVNDTLIQDKNDSLHTKMPLFDPTEAQLKTEDLVRDKLTTESNMEIEGIHFSGLTTEMIVRTEDIGPTNQRTKTREKTVNIANQLDDSLRTDNIDFIDVITEASIKTEDSGIADLTSPEGETPIRSRYGESKTDSIGSEPTSKTNLHTEDTKDIRLTNQFNGSNYDDDDTRPLSEKPDNDNTLLSHFDIHSKSMDYYSPLQSPTLVSRASITLRSVSSDEGLGLSEKLLGRAVDLNEDKVDTSVFSGENTPNKELLNASANFQSCHTVSADSAYDSSITDAQKNYSPVAFEHEQSKIQGQFNIFDMPSEQELVETTLEQACFMSYTQNQESNFKTSEERDNESLLQTSLHFKPSTIAEYKIGLSMEESSKIKETILYEHAAADYLNNQHSGSSDNEEACTNESSSMDPLLSIACSEYPSQFGIIKMLQNETDQPLELHNIDSTNHTVSTSVTYNEESELVLTRNQNDSLGIDTNAFKESLVDVPIYVKNNNTTDLLRDNEEQCRIQHIKIDDIINVTNNFCDVNQKTETEDNSIIFQTLNNRDFSLEEDA